MTAQEIEHSLIKNQINFIATNPGHYVQLETKFGTTRIATLVSNYNNVKLKKFSSVIFTHSDSDIEHLNDLNGKTIAAVNDKAFGGFRIIQDMLKGKGIETLKDMKPIWVGFPQSDIVKVVLSRSADVGVVRSGVLEKLINSNQFKRSQIRVLNQQISDDFPLMRSADLFPEWPFIKSPKTDDKIAKQVAIALMQMPISSSDSVHSNDAGWTIPVDYSSVHSLLRRLKVDPYLPQALSRTQLFKDYWHWFLIFGLFGLTIFLLLGYYLRANRNLNIAYKILSKKERTLEDTVLKRTEELYQTNQDLQEEIEHLKSADLCISQCSETLGELYQTFTREDLPFQQKVQLLVEEIKRYMGFEIVVVSVFENGKYKVQSISPVETKLSPPLSLTGVKLATQEQKMLILENHDGWNHYIVQPAFCEDALYCVFEFVSSKDYQHNKAPLEENSLQLRNQLFQLILTWIAKEICAFESKKSSNEKINLIRNRFSTISTREKEVLELLIQGNSSKEIARILDLSPRTVEMHKANLMQKTDTKSSLKLIQLAILSQKFT